MFSENYEWHKICFSYSVAILAAPKDGELRHYEEQMLQVGYVVSMLCSMQRVLRKARLFEHIL